MRHIIPAWIRIPAAMVLIVATLEYFIDSEGQCALMEYPVLIPVVLMALLFLIALEIILNAIENIMFQTLDSDSRERYLRVREERMSRFDLKRIYNKAMGSRPLSEERDIELDHNYDGIKELDNTLPPWWLYSFYASIVFAAGYLVYYHALDGDNQYEELETELAEAKLAVEEYKKNAPDLVDAESVVLLTEAGDLESGSAIFQSNCMACHAPDGGGGIGPNLTDEHWILGGGIKNVFHTISEGGRAGKGMVAWNSTLKPTEIQQVASYVLSLQGSSPASPKAAEGDIWLQE